MTDRIELLIEICPGCDGDYADHCGWPCESWILGCHAAHDDDPHACRSFVVKVP